MEMTWNAGNRVHVNQASLNKGLSAIWYNIISIRVKWIWLEMKTWRNRHLFNVIYYRYKVIICLRFFCFFQIWRNINTNIIGSLISRLSKSVRYADWGQFYLIIHRFLLFSFFASPQSGTEPFRNLILHSSCRHVIIPFAVSLRFLSLQLFSNMRFLVHLPRHLRRDRKTH